MTQIDDDTPSQTVSGGPAGEFQSGEICGCSTPGSSDCNFANLIAERKAGVRHLFRCGYDVIRNAYFVEDKIGKGSKLSDLLSSTNFYPSFDDFFQSVGGKIYKNSSFYQCSFSDEQIQRYGLDLKRIKEAPFVKETAADYILEPSELEKEKYLENEKRKQVLLGYIDELRNCNDVAAFQKIISSARDSSRFLLYSYIALKKEAAFDIVLKYLNKHYDCLNFVTYSLCYFYNPERVISARVFNSASYSTNRRYRNNLRQFANDLQNGTISWQRYGYFDAETHFFVLERQIVKGDRIIARAPTYFSNFPDFALYLNNDLSGCNLSAAPISANDVALCKTDANTRLPPACYAKLEKVIESEYEPGDKKFAVYVKWKTPEGQEVKKDSVFFDYFVDYVSFLGGDLSHANLRFCDGLMNLKNTAGLHFEGAILPGSFLVKIGADLPKLALPEGPAPLPATLEEERRTAESLALIQPDALDDDGKPVYYISDLHLVSRIKMAGCQSPIDIQVLFERMAQTFLSEIWDRQGWRVHTLPLSVLLIGGDVTIDWNYFKEFVTILHDKLIRRAPLLKIVFVLGNHELWAFKNQTREETIKIYSEFLKSNGMYLLSDSLLSFDDDGRVDAFSSESLINQSKEQLEKGISKGRVIVFGGPGFSGDMPFPEPYGGPQDPEARKQDEERKEGEPFYRVYAAVENKLGDKRIIVLTHAPIESWLPENHLHPNFIYVNGHNHHNAFHDDGVERLYADNQIGYTGKEVHLKCFRLDDRYDCLEKLPDGINEITKEQYLDFCHGKNISISLALDISSLYALKKKGIYCFLYRNKQKQLVLLNGGSKLILPESDIEHYFDNMDRVIAEIQDPLGAYTAKEEDIARDVRRIGGSGRIHGCIVDIDFFNHIYLNPSDGKVTPYYALNIIDKQVFPSTLALLENKNPELYRRAKTYLAKNGKLSETLIAESQNAVGEVYLDTDIYKASRLIKKMQKLSSGVLCFWREPIRLPKMVA